MSRLDQFPGKELITQYREVFSRPAARAVLTHMLFDLGVFVEVTEGPEDIALKNYGIRLLTIIGGGEIGDNAIDGLVTRLIKQPIPKGNGDSDED